MATAGWRVEASARECVRVEDDVREKCRGAQGGENLLQQNVTIPASFPIDFLGKLTGRAMNGNHMIAEDCNKLRMRASCQAPR